MVRRNSIGNNGKLSGSGYGVASGTLIVKEECGGAKESEHEEEKE